MAEIITEEKSLSSGGAKRKMSIIILIIVVIILIVVGYVVSQRDTSSLFNNNSETPIVGELDYQKPFGIFATMPIESGVDLIKSTLSKYEEGQEINTISYNSSKTADQTLADFENYFTQNGWEIINKDATSIYGENDINSINILVEENAGSTSVIISHVKEITEEILE